MLLGLLVAAALAQEPALPGPLLPAQPGPDGVPAYLDAVPAAPDGCRVAANNDNVVIDCAGVALLVAAGDGARSGLVRLVDEQVAPFAQAGLPVTEAEDVACTLKGVPARCVSREVSVPGGAAMRVLGGVAADGSYTAICLRRGAGVADACADVVVATP